MNFSLDHCEHRASQAGLGSSDNGRIMDKNCLLPVCPSFWSIQEIGGFDV
jgi:hypothetical protein